MTNPNASTHMSSSEPAPRQMRLYDQAARRLYLNAAERTRFINAARRATLAQESFGLTLLYTGCRISEALSLTTSCIQFETEVLTIQTLKRRRTDHFREIPIPPELAAVLQAQARDAEADQLLWKHQKQTLNRSTGYRWIKRLMREAGIIGVHASPKGLRHGFGIHALQSDVPLNLLQKWMGHADIETTAIYANACGPEERAIAARMW
ncbi:tyrosine-type recombinase/integrase [Yoonia sp. 2307UL14-13]|uniref:tyrosine-type recombinase/integrase n=1 Tax=Yoonia sp. 2307UL14-13 TaxID=3126506 RepID=UPI00309E75AD